MSINFKQNTPKEKEIKEFYKFFFKRENMSVLKPAAPNQNKDIQPGVGTISTNNSDF